ncbi:hypothetical protein AQUCO_03200024v1 [Aquilegia coerulea]|uniref:Uncharacterized protein n=1 Tax=Aquilegia coerulea TaxID=218851 RepID=A0A2G5CZT4_AQUCA|nr:hypothetical protein AQUCO_03200024v1 [Aquilegia coerulea]
MVNGCSQKLDGSGNGFYQLESNMMVMGVNQSGDTPSSYSEVSATDSMVMNMNRKKLTVKSDTESGSDEINVTFIDFLGVGAT